MKITSIIVPFFITSVIVKYALSFIMRCYSEILTYYQESAFDKICRIQPPLDFDFVGQEKCLFARKEINRITNVVPTFINILKNTIENTSMCPYYESCPKLFLDVIDGISSPWMLLKISVITAMVTLMVHAVLSFNHRQQADIPPKKKKDNTVENDQRAFIKAMIFLKNFGMNFYNPMGVIKKIPFPFIKGRNNNNNKRFKNVKKQQSNSIKNENDNNSSNDTDDEKLKPYNIPYTNWEEWARSQGEQETFLESDYDNNEVSTIPYYDTNKKIL